MRFDQEHDSCTTILVGKKASYDGSTLVARTEDSCNGEFTPKKFIVVRPEDQPRHYKAVISGFETDLPNNPVRYTAMPNAINNEGIWGAAGINAYNVALSATETISTNPRVLGADPLVETGIGEEDIFTLVLPYIKTAREGVERLGHFLETAGTYESNGIAISDVNEIWWLESIGGHHWMARRVPDDAYVVNPNQLGSDFFDFDDKENYMCDPDLKDFMIRYHLNLNFDGESFNPRYAFGSQRDKDRLYNTPRAWDIQRMFNPEVEQSPTSFEIPWARVPYRKITVEDVKESMSTHFQFTPYDPYGNQGDGKSNRRFRTVGINRTSQTAILQIRPNRPHDTTGIQWVSYGSMPFTTAVPFFTQVDTTPAYFANTTAKVSTDSFYWSSRLIAGLADAHYLEHLADIESYQKNTLSRGEAMIAQVDAKLEKGEAIDFEAENQQMSDFIEEKTAALLDKVLLRASNLMVNHYSVSD